MANHFTKYRGLKNNMTKNLKQSYIDKMIVREPKMKIDNLHPEAKKKWN